jgi:hypothetical protein
VMIRDEDGDWGQSTISRFIFPDASAGKLWSTRQEPFLSNRRAGGLLDGSPRAVLVRNRLSADGGCRLKRRDRGSNHKVAQVVPKT